MDVRPSPEQEALRDAAVQMGDRLGPKAVGQIGDPDRTARLDAAVAESGWRELRGATEQGSPLASGVEAAIVAEEFGKALADVSFLGPTLAAELRRIVGGPDGVTGETVVLDADLAGLASAGEGRSSGVAIDAQGCTHALLLVADSGHFVLAQVALPATSSGVDLTRPSAVFDPLPAAVLVEGTQRPMMADDLSRWTALALSLGCADLVGIMRGATQLSCDYAKNRRQYGAAIGSFQAVQHMLADAFAVTEGARSIALHAAWAVDALPVADAMAAAAAAKAYCARAAREVCETAIQVHGGVGNTWECLAHVYLRRAFLSIDICGDANANLARVLRQQGIGGGDGLR